MILNFIRVLKHKYINIYQLNIHTFFLNILFVSLKTMIIFGVPPAIIQHHYVCYMLCLLVICTLELFILMYLFIEY